MARVSIVRLFDKAGAEAMLPSEFPSWPVARAEKLTVPVPTAEYVQVKNPVPKPAIDWLAGAGPET